MLVTNLVSWAGPDWTCLPGEQIDLPDDVAVARLEAGLVALVELIEPPKRGRKNNNDDNNNG